MKKTQKKFRFQPAILMLVAFLTFGAFGASAQKDLRVVGVVTDSIGEPVIGATARQSEPRPTSTVTM